MTMTDTERLDWLEKQTTLHCQVEVLYVVDGYEAAVLHDDNVMSLSRRATYREAIDALAAGLE